MLQKEMAARLSAAPGSKDYGAFTLLIIGALASYIVATHHPDTPNVQTPPTTPLPAAEAIHVRTLDVLLFDGTDDKERGTFGDKVFGATLEDAIKVR